MQQLLARAIQSIGYERDDDPIKIRVDGQVSSLINVDDKRFELALINVLRNALQAAKSEIVVSLRGGDTVEICVCDDGPDRRRHEKHRHTTFNSTKPQGKGTGLGLTIVSHVMTDHHGSMTLENAEHGGCCVRLRLPASKE